MEVKEFNSLNDFNLKTNYLFKAIKTLENKFRYFKPVINTSHSCFCDKEIKELKDKIFLLEEKIKETNQVIDFPKNILCSDIKQNKETIITNVNEHIKNDNSLNNNENINNTSLLTTRMPSNLISNQISKLNNDSWDGTRPSQDKPPNKLFYTKIGFWTICSSVATSSSKANKRKIEISELDEDDSGTKAALNGAAEDASGVHTYLIDKSKEYINQGKFEFSSESVGSLSKENLLISLRNYFNSPSNEASLIYYSGHGFEDAKLMMDTASGSYYINYKEIISLWKERNNPNKNKHLLIILDCCFSGSWVIQLLENGDFIDVSIQASSTDKQKSNDLGRGKGSLYTGLFFKSNDYIRQDQGEINFYDVKLQDKYKYQQPIAFGFYDIIKQDYNFKNLISNSWAEMLNNYVPLRFKNSNKSISGSFTEISHKSPDIQNFENDISMNNINSFNRINNELLFGYFENIVFVIRENTFSCQAELYNEAERTKYKFHFIYNNINILNNTKGHIAIFKNNYKLNSASTENNRHVADLRVEESNAEDHIVTENNEEYLNQYSGKYFNTVFKKRNIFELQSSQIKYCLDYLNDLVKLLKSSKIEYNEKLKINNIVIEIDVDSPILELYKKITEMNKSYLVLDSLDILEESEIEEENVFDLLNSNNRNKLETLEIKESITTESENVLCDYIRSSQCSIKKLVIVNSSKNPLNNLIASLLNNTSIRSLEITLNNCNYKLMLLIEEVLYSLKLVDFKLKYENKSQKQYLTDIEYYKENKEDEIELNENDNNIIMTKDLLVKKQIINNQLQSSMEVANNLFTCLFMSQYLKSITFENTHKNWNRDIIKTLIIETLEEFNLHGVVLSREELEYMNDFLKNHTKLKKLSIVNCNLDRLPYIPCSLTDLNLRKNNLNNNQIEKLLDILKTHKLKYRVDLSSNIITEVSIIKVKEFLIKNNNCVELNLSKNLISSDNYYDILSIVNYNNTLIKFDVSGVQISNTKTFSSLLKNQKTIRQISFKNCYLFDQSISDLFSILSAGNSNIINYIDISGNYITQEKSLMQIGSAIRYREILEVVLMKNCVNIKNDIEMITNTSKTSNKIELDSKENKNNSVGLKIWIDRFFGNNNLRKVDYSDWKINNENSAFYLRNVLSENSNLIEINISKTIIEFELNDTKCSDIKGSPFSSLSLSSAKINYRQIELFRGCKIKEININTHTNKLSNDNNDNLDYDDLKDLDSLLISQKLNLHSLIIDKFSSEEVFKYLDIKYEKMDYNIMFDSYTMNEEILLRSVFNDTRIKVKNLIVDDIDFSAFNSILKNKNFNLLERVFISEEMMTNTNNKTFDSIANIIKGILYENNENKGNDKLLDFNIHLKQIISRLISMTTKTKEDYNDPIKQETLFDEDYLLNYYISSQMLFNFNYLFIDSNDRNDKNDYFDLNNYIKIDSPYIYIFNQNYGNKNSFNHEKINDNNNFRETNRFRPYEKQDNYKIQEIETEIAYDETYTMSHLESFNREIIYYDITEIKYLSLTSNYFNLNNLVDYLNDNKTIEILELDNVYFKKFGEILIKYFIGQPLKVLIIKNTEFNSSELILLKSIFTIFNNIEHVALVNTYIDSVESITLFEGLGILNNLISLDLSENYLENMFVTNLIEFIDKNKNITYTNKDSNKSAIKNLILRNTNLSFNNFSDLSKVLSTNITISYSNNHTSTKEPHVLDYLDISGIRFNQESILTKKEDYFDTFLKTSSLHITYSNTLIPTIPHYSFPLLEISLSHVDLDLIKIKLYTAIKDKLVLNSITFNHCYKEKSVTKLIYLLHKVTPIKKIAIIDCLVNKSNVKYLSKIVSLNTSDKNNKRNNNHYYLTHLKLDNCQLEDQTFFIIFEKVLNSSKLIELDLSRNNLGKSSLISILKEIILNKYTSNLISIILYKSFSSEFNIENNNIFYNFKSKKCKNSKDNQDNSNDNNNYSYLSEAIYNKLIFNIENGMKIKENIFYYLKHSVPKLIEYLLENRDLPESNYKYIEKIIKSPYTNKNSKCLYDTKLDNNFNEEMILDYSILNLKPAEYVNYGDNISDMILYKESQIITGTKEGALDIYNIYSGRINSRIKIHDQNIFSMKLINDTLIATVSFDYYIKILDLITMQVIYIESTKGTKVACLELISKNKLVYVNNKQLSFIEINSSNNNPINNDNPCLTVISRIIETQEENIFCSVKAMNDDYFITLFDNKIQLRSTNTLEVLVLFNNGINNIYNIPDSIDSTNKFSYNEYKNILILDSESYLIYNLKYALVFNIYSNFLVKKLAFEDYIITISLYNGINDILIVSLIDNSIKIIYLRTGKVLYSIITEHINEILNIVFLTNNIFISSGEDGRILLHKVDFNEIEKSIYKSESIIKNDEVVYNNDKQAVVFDYSEEHDFYYKDCIIMDEKLKKISDSKNNNIIDNSNDRTKVYNMSCSSNTLEIKSFSQYLHNKTILEEIKDTSVSGVSVFTLFDEKHILLGYERIENYNIFCFDFISKERIKVYQGHYDSVNALCKINTKYFASSGNDNRIKIWDYLSTNCVYVFIAKDCFALKLHTYVNTMDIGYISNDDESNKTFSLVYCYNKSRIGSLNISNIINKSNKSGKENMRSEDYCKSNNSILNNIINNYNSHKNESISELSLREISELLEESYNCISNIHKKDEINDIRKIKNHIIGIYNTDQFLVNDSEYEEYEGAYSIDYVYQTILNNFVFREMNDVILDLEIDLTHEMDKIIVNGREIFFCSNENEICLVGYKTDEGIDRSDSLVLLNKIRIEDIDIKVPEDKKNLDKYINNGESTSENNANNNFYLRQIRESHIVSIKKYNKSDNMCLLTTKTDLIYVIEINEDTTETTNSGNNKKPLYEIKCTDYFLIRLDKENYESLAIDVNDSSSLENYNFYPRSCSLSGDDQFLIVSICTGIILFNIQENTIQLTKYTWNTLSTYYLYKDYFISFPYKLGPIILTFPNFEIDIDFDVINNYTGIFHHFGNFVFMVNGTFSIYYCDLVSKEIIGKFVGHTNYVRNIVFKYTKTEEINNCKDSLIISCSVDNTVKIWMLKEFKLLYTIDSNSPVYSLCYLSDDVIAFQYNLYYIGIHDINKDYRMRNLYLHNSHILKLHTHDKERFISGSYDCLIGVWNYKTFQLVGKLVGHSGSVYNLCSLNEDNIASYSGDNSIRIWSLKLLLCLYSIDTSFINPLYDKIKSDYNQQNILFKASEDTIVFSNLIGDIFYLNLITKMYDCVLLNGHFKENTHGNIDYQKLCGGSRIDESSFITVSWEEIKYWNNRIIGNKVNDN